jgi:hypothetical protein
MSELCCDDSKPTRFGFDAYCRLAPKHRGDHESMDFTWSDDDAYALSKGLT